MFELSDFQKWAIDAFETGKNVLITSKVACYGFKLKKEEYPKSKLGELKAEISDIINYREGIESDLSSLDYCVNRARNLIKEMEK